MDYTIEEKYNLIMTKALQQTSKNPVIIAKNIMHEKFISMHGPEHHFLDGAAFLMAYKNAGGDIDINKSLNTLAKRTIAMPGAMCGFWGVCGSTTSVGACLSIINETGPLSDNDYYKDNMQYTSSVIEIMSKIGGPRCCKRNAFISLTEGAKFAYKKYKIPMETSTVVCEFSSLNNQCILERCPFYKR